MAKMKIKKPTYPLVIVCARDWQLYSDQRTIDENFDTAIGWVVGFLISEDDKKMVIASNYFQESPIATVRETTVIPKETIILKRKIKFEGE